MSESRADICMDVEHIAVTVSQRTTYCIAEQQLAELVYGDDVPDNIDFPSMGKKLVEELKARRITPEDLDLAASLSEKEDWSLDDVQIMRLL